MIAAAGDPVIVAGQYIGVLVMGASIVLIGCVAAVVSWRDERARRRDIARAERRARAVAANNAKWACVRKDSAT